MSEYAFSTKNVQPKSGLGSNMVCMRDLGRLKIHMGQFSQGVHLKAGNVTEVRLENSDF